MADLKISLEQSVFSGRPIAVITLKGALDNSSEPQLLQTVKDCLTESACFIFDLSRLRIQGSPCLGVFIKIATWAREKSGDVVIIRPSPEIDTAFGLIGLWEYLAKANGLDDALKLICNRQSGGPHT